MKFVAKILTIAACLLYTSNLTNHAYWNLSGKLTIDSMTLEVRASAYTPVLSLIHI